MKTNETPRPPSIEASNFFDASSTILTNLYCRWLDEKDYEDIGDYLQPFQTVAEKTGVQLIKMTARPFAVHYKVDDGREYQAFCNSRQVGYKRTR